jgi:glycerophosphoryl diester phosphodiesterase
VRLSPLIASHRGGAFPWPENSLRAFRESAGLRIEQVECDVHLSADGEVVVMHDATLERMTDARGPVAALDAAALRRVRVKGTDGEAVPTLAEFLGVLKPTPIAPRVEIKADVSGQPYPGAVARTLEVLDAAGMRARSWVIGFNAPEMAEVLEAGGLAGVAWLLEARTWRDLGLPGVVAVARSYGFPEIGVHEQVLDVEPVAALRAAGIGIGVWGANHEASIRRAMKLGVDVLTTDDPRLAVELRGG